MYIHDCLIELHARIMTQVTHSLNNQGNLTQETKLWHWRLKHERSQLRHKFICTRITYIPAHIYQYHPWIHNVPTSMCNLSTVCVSLTEPYSPVFTSHAVVLLNWREDKYTVRTLWTVDYSRRVSSWRSKVTRHTKYDVVMNTSLSMAIWQHYPVAISTYGMDRKQIIYISNIYFLFIYIHIYT